MSFTRPFKPNNASTAKIAATTTSGSAALTNPGGDVRIYNAGTVLVFVKFGIGSAPTAANTDIPIAPGTTEILSADSATHVAAITATGTADVYFTTGKGI